jgi:hypothetical protein
VSWCLVCHECWWALLAECRRKKWKDVTIQLYHAELHDNIVQTARFQPVQLILNIPWFKSLVILEIRHHRILLTLTSNLCQMLYRMTKSLTPIFSLWSAANKACVYFVVQVASHFKNRSPSDSADAIFKPPSTAPTGKAYSTYLTKLNLVLPESV